MRGFARVARPLVLVGVLAGVALTAAGTSSSSESGQGRWVIRDLSTTVGKLDSSAWAINDRGQILIELGGRDIDLESRTAPSPPVAGALVWQNGSLTDLGRVAGKKFSAPVAINDRGQIVGYSWTHTDMHGDELDDRAFLWERGRITDLGTLGGASAAPAAINDAGQVVGSSEIKPNDVSIHAFVWKSGKMTDLGAGPRSSAVAINDRGQIAGTSEELSTRSRAFLFQDGKMTVLGPLPAGTTESRARAINEQGLVLGDWSSNARGGNYLWQGGKVTLLGGLEASAMNDHGQVVGRVDVVNRSKFHASLWQNGKLTNLGMVPGASQSEATAINNRGQIVGRSGDFENVNRVWFHAFVWQNGRITDLGTLPGGTASKALAINERGQIVGLSTTKNGQEHAVLWTFRSGA
jgi:probable HAF family extracellular repeat protein